MTTPAQIPTPAESAPPPAVAAVTTPPTMAQDPQTPVHDPNAPAPAFDPRTIDGDHELSPDEARLMLNYDPFEELASAGIGESPKAPAAPEPTGVVAQPAAPPQAGQVAPAQPAPPAAPDPALAQLQVAIQSLQAQNAELAARLAGVAPAAQPSTAQATPAVDPLVGNYSFNVPEALLQGIRSEDPAQYKAAIETLIRGIGTHVHQQVMQAVPTLIAQEAPKHISPVLEQRETQQKIYNDFYSSYPQYNNENVKPIVRQAAAEISSLYPQAPWSPQLMQMIGERTRMKIAALVQPQNPPQAQVLGFQQPAVVLPPGSPVPATQVPVPQVAPTARPGPIAPVNDTEAMVREMMAANLGLL